MQWFSLHLTQEETLNLQEGLEKAALVEASAAVDTVVQGQLQQHQPTS